VDSVVSAASGGRRDRNDRYEAVKAHNAVVTCATFSPDPARALAQIGPAASPDGYALVSADHEGDIKIFYAFVKPAKKSSSLSREK